MFVEKSCMVVCVSVGGGIQWYLQRELPPPQFPFSLSPALVWVLLMRNGLDTLIVRNYGGQVGLMGHSQCQTTGRSERGCLPF